MDWGAGWLEPWKQKRKKRVLGVVNDRTERTKTLHFLWVRLYWFWSDHKIHLMAKGRASHSNYLNCQCFQCFQCFKIPIPATDLFGLEIVWRPLSPPPPEHQPAQSQVRICFYSLFYICNCSCFVFSAATFATTSKRATDFGDYLYLFVQRSSRNWRERNCI